MSDGSETRSGGHAALRAGRLPEERGRGASDPVDRVSERPASGRLASGRVAIVGLGPGDERMRTAQAEAALAEATDLVGYGPYLDRVAVRAGQVRHASDNRVELERAGLALRLAAAGRRVAVVSAGDAGVFAMASAVFEVMESGWQGVEVEVVPGISAMFAAAARVGAPLGADFCAVSLSDNLKPWEVVLRRVLMAAEAGFVIALYNPVSRARPWQLGAVLERLGAVLAGETPVVFATAVSRPEERVEVVTLAGAAAVVAAGRADMRTLVLIGSAATRRIERQGKAPVVYSLRRVPA